jgi:hypothetical protein
MLLPLLFALLLTGCGRPHSAKPQPQQSASAANPAQRDSATTGDLAGQVFWVGDVPKVPPFVSVVSPLTEATPRLGLHEWANPGAPAIDPDGGLGQAVVFLRKVDPQRAKPWDLPPVRVEMFDHRIRVCQGDTVGRTGFVRRGDAVEFVSKEPAFHSVQARGAAFFALPLPDANQPRRRTLDHEGVVELSSGAGYYWMRGYLLVLDHPYVTLTDAQGYFTLWQVPAGKYELVVWHPNWQEASHSRDADTCQICRMTLQPPLEVVRTLEVGPGETRLVRVGLSVKKPCD